MKAKRNQQPIPENSEVVMKAAARMIDMVVDLFGPFLQVSVLIELLKQSAVKRALRRCENERPNAKPTLTELSLATGLNTREVKQQLQEPRPVSDLPICTEAAILERWAKEPAWRERATGKPMDLAIFGNDGSFQGLVVRLGGRGISTAAVLRRLEEGGYVKQVNKIFVRLIDPNWRFIEDNEHEILDFGSQALVSLGRTIQHNLVNRHNTDDKHVERRVCSTRIVDTASAKTKVGALILKQKEEMLELLKSLEEPGGNSTEVVIGAGYYFWLDE